MKTEDILGRLYAIRKQVDELVCELEPDSSSDTSVSFLSDVHALKVYEAYPKKVGRKKGLQKLTRLIKSEKDFKQVMFCLNNYIKHVSNERARGFNLNFKQFDVFVNCYDDFLEIPKTEAEIQSEIRAKQREASRQKWQREKQQEQEQPVTQEERAERSRQIQNLMQSIVKPIE